MNPGLGLLTRVPLAGALRETSKRKEKQMEPCKHPFVWPDGNCVECDVLATQFPAWAEPHHTMLLRKFEPLVKAFKDAEASKTRVLKELNEKPLSLGTATNRTSTFPVLISLSRRW